MTLEQDRTMTMGVAATNARKRFLDQIKKLEYREFGIAEIFCGDAVLISVEPLDPKYFDDPHIRQRCIVRADGENYWTFYD